MDSPPPIRGHFFGRPLTRDELEAFVASGAEDIYPTETMYCIGRPDAMHAIFPEDGERLVAMGYLRPAPEVGPGRWWALADGITKSALDAALARMRVEFPRHAVEVEGGHVVVFDPDPPARSTPRPERRDGTRKSGR